MRRILFVVLIVVLTCSLAPAQSVKLPAKPQVKGAEELKVLIQDKVLDSYFANTKASTTFACPHAYTRHTHPMPFG